MDRAIPKQYIFYGWWIAFTALFVNAILSAPSFGATGLWIDSLERDFGWTRAQLSLAFSLGQLEGSIAAPIVGFLIDRFGGKKIALSGAFVASLGFVCLSQVTPFTPGFSEWNDPLIFYAAYVLIMLGVTLGGWIPMTVIINNWFQKNRSLAMSIGSVGFSVGTFAIVPALAILVSPDSLGWRNTALLIAVIFTFIALPVWKIIRNNPEDIGEIPDGMGKEITDGSLKREDSRVPNIGQDFTITEALREKVFWIISIGHGASAMLTSTMMVHLILAFKDQGLSIEMAAVMWGISMGIGGASQIFGGVIGDRIPKRFALCAFGCLQAIGVSSAILVRSVPMAVLFAVIYGIGFGGRAPITTSMRGEYFGRRSFGKIMGISAVPMMLMTMTGPIVAGSFFDQDGDYTRAFLLLATVGFTGSLIFIFATKPIHPSLKNHSNIAVEN
ncbi:MAG: MFS transporter [Chloroflexota bacterium]|nr:MFS transporter [Chloroflexota bacterium]